MFDVKQRRLVRRGEINTQLVERAPLVADDLSQPDVPARPARQVDKAGLAAAVRQRPAHLRGDHRAQGRLAHLSALDPTDAVRPPPADARLQRPTTRPEAIAPPLPGVGIDAPNETVVRTWRPFRRATWRHSGSRTRSSNAACSSQRPVSRGSSRCSVATPWSCPCRDLRIPRFAAGALRRLSNLQATEDDPERDMEPGKIPHEIRHGELAQLGIMPYTPYYGTHDATSLFVIVISHLYQWLGDVEVLRRYLPNAEAAMTWIDTLWRPRRRRLPGVQDPLEPRLLQPGLEGRRRCDPEADGSIAELPIGAVRAAGLRLRREAAAGRHLRDAGPGGRRGAAPRRGTRASTSASTTILVGARGDLLPGPRRSRSGPSSRSRRTRVTACQRDRADGSRRASRGTADAPRHVVRVGDPHAVADHVAYNPFSYHTGTVWPHDNAIIAGGFRRYGFPDRGRARRQGHLRRRRALRRQPAAGAVRRPAAPAGQLSGPVPRRQRPPGVGRRVRLPVDRHPVRDPCLGRTRTSTGCTSTRPCPTGCRGSRSATSVRAGVP